MDKVHRVIHAGKTYSCNIATEQSRNLYIAQVSRTAEALYGRVVDYDIAPEARAQITPFGERLMVAA